MTWPTVELGQIGEFRYGKSLPASLRHDGPVPVYGSNGAVGSHSVALTCGPTVVVGRKGSFGEVHFSDHACWPIDTTYYVDGSATDVDLRWLYWTLPSLRLTELNRAAAIPGLNREDAYRRRLMLPPLAEQRRIAAILDQADALRVKRRKSLGLLDDLARSVYVQMFDGHDWPRRALVDLCVSPDDIKCGPFGTQLQKSEFREVGVPLWGIKNVNAKFELPAWEFLDERTAQRLSQYSVLPDDIVMTRKGTIGNCAVYPEGFPLGIMHSDLLRLRMDKRRVLSPFLSHQLHEGPRVARQLHAVSGGAVMPGINVTKLKRLVVDVPPMDLQREFVERTTSIAEQRVLSTGHSASLRGLFSTLQAHAFSGALGVEA